MTAVPAPTVKERIVAVLLAGLAAIDGVAVVVDAQLQDADTKITAAVIGDGTPGSGGAVAIELVIGDDQAVGEEDSLTLEELQFPFAAIIHMPDRMAEDVTPAMLAARYRGAVYTCYAASDAAPDQDRFVSSGTPLAKHTKLLGGGGGPSRDPELATLVTYSHGEVHYRHTRGDPTTPR